MSDQPLASYRERLPAVSRVLHLYPDRVQVEATWRFGKSYQQTIPLDTLKPDPRRFGVRQKLFKRALGIGALAAATAVVLTRPGVTPIPHWASTLLWAIAALGAIVAAISFPRVTFARFSDKEGKPALDIAQAGPDSRAFDEFIELIRKRIRRN